MALQGSLEEAARVVSEKAREAAINLQEARARHDDTETMARQIEGSRAMLVKERENLERARRSHFADPTAAIGGGPLPLAAITANSSVGDPAGAARYGDVVRRQQDFLRTISKQH